MTDINQARVERMLRELRSDPATQMCERMLRCGLGSAEDLGLGLRTVLFVVVISLGIAANVSDRMLKVRIADSGGDLASVDLEGETAASVTAAHLRLLGSDEKFEVVRLGEREIRARMASRLPPGAYVLLIGTNPRVAGDLRSVSVHVGPVGPVVQDN